MLASPMTRHALLWSLLGCVIALVCLTIVLVPYRTEIVEIDRRDGRTRLRVVTWLVWERIQMSRQDDFSNYGTTTAPAGWFPVDAARQTRFPWSHGREIGVPGADFGAELFRCRLELIMQSPTRRLDAYAHAFLRGIIARRIPIWNAITDASAARAAMALFAEENLQYFGER